MPTRSPNHVNSNAYAAGRRSSAFCRSNGGTDSVEAKARKACVNCRRQKMRCLVEQDETCRRCKRANLQCVFVPRANAAGLWKPTFGGSPETIETEPSGMVMNILRRVKAIEDYIGLSSCSSPQQDTETDAAQSLEVSEQDKLFEPLWRAAACLERCRPGQPGEILWRRDLVKHLFQTFHQKMPGFHFLPDKQRYSSPRPLLLASMLYCSSVRGTADVAELAPKYFAVLCSAISQLSIPDSEIGTPPSETSDVEEWAFQNVLGLVLAGLLAEASIRETGIWISIAYRLIIEYYPPYSDDRAHDWKKLFNGVQIVDLEHASLHLSSPVIPIEPPTASLRTSDRDQLCRLSRMMHAGLAHFTGRGLPTIWSCFTTDAESPHKASPPRFGSSSQFTAVDAAVMRDWARQLDDWLAEFVKAADNSQGDRTTVFRQYVLHRLVVLSIYHPARDCDLHSNITPHEQHELLLSARATVKLHINDKTIWSNWDLVMITWAAMIVVQGVESGVGEQDDLRNIRMHLAALRATNEPKPSLRGTLASRLEQAMKHINTPSPQLQRQDTAEMPPMNLNLDYSEYLFNQQSLGQVMYAAWPTSSTEMLQMM